MSYSATLKNFLFLSVLSVVTLCYAFVCFPGYFKAGANNTSPANMSSAIHGDFVLTDHKNRVVDSRLIKKYKLVYFGFSHCPHICPTNLRFMSEIIEQSGSLKRFYGVYFITVDPARDTVERLNEYHKKFDPSIVMLTGEKEKIDELAKRMRVFYSRVSSLDENYDIDHSSIIYLLDKRNEYVTHFNVSDNVDKVIHIMRQHIGI